MQMLRFLRLPTALLGTGIGSVAWLSYKFNEFKKNVVPDWLRNSPSNIMDWLNSHEFYHWSVPSSDFDIGDTSFPEWRTFADFKEAIHSHFRRETEPTDSLLQEAPAPPTTATNKFAHHPLHHTSTYSSLPSREDTNVVHGDNIVRRTFTSNSSDQIFGSVTRKLIEIRQLLASCAVDEIDLNLPTIAVIGSQSSGKSSVLEAVVGHEFLPKGTNMVTKCPIELTLVHDLEADNDFAFFPDIPNLGNTSDFARVQSTLTSLSEAIPESQCISEEPIQLHIHSARLPNLTLVDLPGYIQIHNRSQPSLLEEKISTLCEKYIQYPNIILAVNAADVDLANSPALRACRRVDPAGERTIGVLTKMDLVSPQIGAQILEGNGFDLSLGYVGVVAKTTHASNRQLQITRSGPFDDSSFFRAHPEYAGKHVGVSALRSKLTYILHDRMLASVSTLLPLLEEELADVAYKLKAEYNDEHLNAEAYVTDVLDAFKASFKDIILQKYASPLLKEDIKRMISSRVLDVCQAHIWRDSTVVEWVEACSAYKDSFRQQLQAASAALSKGGIGKLAVTGFADNLLSDVNALVMSSGMWEPHRAAALTVRETAASILAAKIPLAIVQVENAIKPFKYEVELSNFDWTAARASAIDVLNAEIEAKKKELTALKLKYGRKAVNETLNMAIVDPGVHVAHAARGKHAAQLHIPVADAERARDLWASIRYQKYRLGLVRGLSCYSQSNKVCCPEVFLCALIEKLASSAALFIQYEIVKDMAFQLPKAVDKMLFYDRDEKSLYQFACENHTVANQLLAQSKKEKISIAVEKLRGVISH